MHKFFGTDGVRGVAYSELTVAMAEVLGKTAVQVLGANLLIGRDTRSSGLDLQAGLVAGIQAAGGQAMLAGIIPTPAVAFLVSEYGAAGGIVISASHNPPEDNGIKFFNNRGFKLTAEQEDAFETALQAMPSIHQSELLSHQRKATTKTETTANAAIALPDAAERYIAHAVSTVTGQGLDFRGLKVVADCAHGAAWHTTPEALIRLNAEVVAINADFNGRDINVDCGSTHLDMLKAAVLANSADLGIAHDGDADRVLAVDALGNEIDGDHILAICAKALKEQGRLSNNLVITTVMANIGLELALNNLGIAMKRTDVGDSRVLAEMLAGQAVLGGEQSGHIIFLNHSSTGDGLISALQLMAVIKQSTKPLTELAMAVQKYPQELINVTVSDKQKVSRSTVLAAELQSAQIELGNSGRVLLRPSGTESVYRVMVETGDKALAQSVAKRFAELIEKIDSEQ
jgi:phosphoglucosamine mutase